MTQQLIFGAGIIGLIIVSSLLHQLLRRIAYPVFRLREEAIPSGPASGTLKDSDVSLSQQVLDILRQIKSNAHLEAALYATLIQRNRRARIISGFGNILITLVTLIGGWLLSSLVNPMDIFPFLRH